MPHRDFEEFIDSLDAEGVRYLVVGAHAVAFHARPRATKDLDRGACWLPCVASSVELTSATRLTM